MPFRLAVWNNEIKNKKNKSKLSITMTLTNCQKIDSHIIWNSVLCIENITVVLLYTCNI